MTRKIRPFTLLLVLLAAMLLTGSVAPAAQDSTALIQAADGYWLHRDDSAALKEAVDTYSQILAQEPDNYQALWRMARAYEWMGKMAEKDPLPLLEKGKAYAEQAIKVNPRGTEGHYWLGALMGRIGEAKGILNSLFMVKPMKAEMDTVAALDPNFASAHYVLSLLYWKVPGKPLSIGDKQKAVEEAKLAVTLDPDNTQFRLGLAEAYIALKDTKAARRELEAVLSMPPTPDDPVQSALDKKDAQAYLAKLK